MISRPRAVLLAILAAVVAASTACGGGRDRSVGMPAYTQHFSMRISSSPAPPHAREKARYKLVVRDKDSGRPIGGGEGILYANTIDGASTWDSFAAGEELGTYYANLNFVVAGNWAMGLRFRRDSTQQLEQVDWMQEVLAERPDTP
ncbi:MAG TPA: hypothetical protein VIQ74_07930 [Gemmatimonadaceae bacterium]